VAVEIVSFLCSSLVPTRSIFCYFPSLSLGYRIVLEICQIEISRIRSRIRYGERFLQIRVLSFLFYFYFYVFMSRLIILNPRTLGFTKFILKSKIYVYNFNCLSMNMRFYVCLHFTFDGQSSLGTM